MTEYWTINDIIKHVVGSGVYKVGDNFYCPSRVNPDWDNHFTIKRITKEFIHWRMYEIRDRKRGGKTIVKFVGSTRIEKFNQGIKEGRYVRL